MKSASIIAAGSVVLLANTLALLHAARNRGGQPDSSIALTERELAYSANSTHDEDSGVTLDLLWTGGIGSFRNDPSDFLLHRTELQRLGFDCSVEPSNPDAVRHYHRQRPRQAFVALEYNGPAWRHWSDSLAQSPNEFARRQSDNQSHLVPIDVDLDRFALRRRHPDRTSVIVTPATIAVGIEPVRWDRDQSEPGKDARIVGRIQHLPISVFVPRPFSEGFRNLAPKTGSADPSQPYTVHLRFGSSLEPWVTGVDFSKAER